LKRPTYAGVFNRVIQKMADLSTAQPNMMANTFRSSKINASKQERSKKMAYLIDK